MELYEKIKKLLKDGYERAGFDVIAEQSNGDTWLRYRAPEMQDVTLKLTRDDVQEYGELLDVRSEFRTLDGVGMVNRKFREHLLRPLDTAIDDDDLALFRFKVPQESTLRIELDQASYVYANFFRFDPGYMQLCLDRLSRIPQRWRQNSATNPVDIRHTLARPLTVRVFDINARSIDAAIHESDALIDNALFTLAYDFDLPLMLASGWPPARAPRLQKLRFQNPGAKPIQLAQGFRRDLVRLYQAGLAAPLAVHRFLAFYQVLEIFFQDVDHAGAFDDLYHLLRDENFVPSQENLSRIVHIVDRNRRELTTAALLEKLLRQHVGTDAVRAAVKRTGGNAQETLGMLAQRLVAIRDAIVSGGAEGAMPGESSLTTAVPLVQYLAEQVILSTQS